MIFGESRIEIDRLKVNESIINFLFHSGGKSKSISNCLESLSLLIAM